MISWSYAVECATIACEQLGDRLWLNMLSDIQHHASIRLLARFGDTRRILMQETGYDLYDVLEDHPHATLRLFRDFERLNRPLPVTGSYGAMLILMLQQIATHPPEITSRSLPWYYAVLLITSNHDITCWPRGLDRDVAQALAVNERLQRLYGITLADCCRIASPGAMYAMTPLLAMASDERFAQLLAVTAGQLVL
ncbi:MAG: hypothetical protein ACR2J8_13990 [Thermomicrobiales bacterium]